jgi:hypothetical protein
MYIGASHALDSKHSPIRIFILGEVGETQGITQHSRNGRYQQEAHDDQQPGWLVLPHRSQNLLFASVNTQGFRGTRKGTLLTPVPNTKNCSAVAKVPSMPQAQAGGRNTIACLDRVWRQGANPFRTPRL